MKGGAEVTPDKTNYALGEINFDAWKEYSEQLAIPPEVPEPEPETKITADPETGGPPIYAEGHPFVHRTGAGGFDYRDPESIKLQGRKEEPYSTANPLYAADDEHLNIIIESLLEQLY